MSIVSFIVIAIAFGISFMLLMQRCADAAPVPLSSGLLISLTMAVVQVALFCVGILLGNMMRFELPEPVKEFKVTNVTSSMSLTFKVARPSAAEITVDENSKTKPASFDLNAGTLRVLLFTVAAGINGFLLGLGAGFVASLATHLHGALWPMLVAVFLLSYLGIMYGRQHVKLRPRRWMVVSALILIVTAIAAVVNAG